MATSPQTPDFAAEAAQPTVVAQPPAPSGPDFAAELASTTQPPSSLSAVSGFEQSSFGRELGLSAPADEGFLKDLGDSFARGWRRMEMGFLNTLDALGVESAGDWRDSIQTMQRFNQERYNRRGANWFERGIEDITYMAPTLAGSALVLGAAGASPVPGDEVAVALALTKAARAARLGRALTASKAATAGILGLQTYGDSLDEVRELSGGKLSEDQMRALAFVKGPLIQGGLEVLTFPGEQIAGAGLANFARKITGTVMKRKSGLIGAEELGKALAGPYLLGGISRAGGVLKTFAGELSEEGVQGAADELLNAYTSGNTTGLIDVATRAYGDMLEAVPSIGMMSLLAGGVSHARAEVSRREVMNNVGTDETAPHWQDVKSVLYGEDAAARSRDDSMVQALTEMFSGSNPTGAKAAAEHITQISRNLALKERRSTGNNTAMPWDYVTGLSVGYMDLTPSQKTDLYTLFKSDIPNKEQAIFRFISQATPNFANSIGEVLDRIDTVETRKTRDSLLNTWNNLTGLGTSQIDTTIKNLGQTRLSEKVEAEAKADGIDITDTTADHFLSKTSVKRILGSLNVAQAVQAKPVDVEIGGKPFRLYVNGDFSGVLSPAKPTQKTAKGVKSIPSIKPEAVQQAKSATAIAAEMTDAQKAIADQMNAKLGLSQPVGQRDVHDLVAKSEEVKAEVEATRPEAIQKPADERLQLTAESLMLQRAIRDREAGAGKWDSIPQERPAKEVVGEPGDQTQINDLLQEVDAEKAAAEATLADLRAQREAGAAADIEARIDEAVAQMERIQAKEAEARANAKPDVEAQAKEIVRQMEAAGIMDPKDQLTALKNQAKKLKLKIAKNANAQAIIAAIAQAQAGRSVAEESQVGDITDTISKGPPLASEGANTLKGLYLPDKLLMLYFQEADAGTFLHEWMHHLTINRLLPVNIELALVEAFGNEDEKKHGYLSETASHEDAGNALLQFIKTDNIPSDAPASLLEAFNYIKGVLKESSTFFRALTVQDKVDAVKADLKGEKPPERRPLELTSPIKDLFQSLLSDKVETTPSQESAARATVESMRSNPPAVEEVSVLDEMEKELEKQAGEPGVLAQEGPSESAKKQLRGFRAKISARAKAGAQKLGYNIDSWYDLGKDAKGNWSEERFQANLRKMDAILRGQSRAIKPVRRVLLKESAVVQNAEAKIGKFLKEFGKLSDSAEENYYNAKGGPKAMNWLIKLAKKPGRLLAEAFSTLETLSLRFSLNGKLADFHDAIWGQSLADQELIDRIKTRISAEDKANIAVIDEWDTVEIEGRERPLAYAFDLYAAADGKKISGSTESFRADVNAKLAKGQPLTPAEKKVVAILESNKVGDWRVTSIDAFNQAVDIVEGNPALKNGFKYTQEKMLEAFNMMNDSLEALYGPEARIPPLEGYYSSQNRMGEGDPVEAMLDEIGRGAAGRIAKGAPLPFNLKPRTDIHGSPITLNYFSKYQSYMASMINAAVRLPTVVEQLKILSNHDLKNLVIQKFGGSSSQAGAENSMWNRMEEAVRATMKVSGRSVPPSAMDVALRERFRLPTSMSLLGAKPWLGFSQLLSSVTAAGDMPMRAMGRMMSVAADIIPYVVRQRVGNLKSWTSGNRLSFNDLPLEGHPLFQKYAAILPTLNRMLGEWEISESQVKQPGVLDNLVRKYGLGRSMADFAFYEMKVNDQMNKLIIGVAAYETKLEELLDGRIGEAEASKQAAAYAESILRKHIPMATNILRTKFHNAPELVRMMSPFSSQPITYFNTVQKDFILPFISAYKMAEGGQTEKLAAALKEVGKVEKLRQAFFLFAAPALLWNMLQRRRPPEKDEFIWDMLTYPFYTIPLAGDIVQSYRMAQSYGGDFWQETPKVPGMIQYYDAARMVKGINQFYKLWQGEDVEWEAAWKNVLAFPTDLTGLPKIFTEAVPNASRARKMSDSDQEYAGRLFLQFLVGGQPLPTREE